MKGIVLAGGSGTRLHPLTMAVSKQLLQVYDKPMVYYPISILMIAGIKEILIITTERDLGLYKRLLSDGSQFGIEIQYKIQDKPNGLAEAFILGEAFIGSDTVCLILGDNLFYGHGLQQILARSVNDAMNYSLASIYGVEVENPEEFGIAEVSLDGVVLSVEEKPLNPKSNIAITGLYFYPNSVVEIAKSIQPSKRGELEITSINDYYLQENRLRLKKLPRGVVWFDTGTHDDLVDANYFIKTIENKTRSKIACLEEIAYQSGWISKERILQNIMNRKGVYYEYLKNKIDDTCS